jgi:hypothetical protein
MIFTQKFKRFNQFYNKKGASVPGAPVQGQALYYTS